MIRPREYKSAYFLCEFVIPKTGHRKGHSRVFQPHPNQCFKKVKDNMSLDAVTSSRSVTYAYLPTVHHISVCLRDSTLPDR